MGEAEQFYCIAFIIIGGVLNAPVSTHTLSGIVPENWKKNKYDRSIEPHTNHQRSKQ